MLFIDETHTPNASNKYTSFTPISIAAVTINTIDSYQHSSKNRKNHSYQLNHNANQAHRRSTRPGTPSNAIIHDAEGGDTSGLHKRFPERQQRRAFREEERSVEERGTRKQHGQILHPTLLFVLLSFSLSLFKSDGVSRT